MPVERDLSGLPRPSDGQARTDGWRPDPSPRFGPLLVEAWHAEADDDLPNAVEGARFRHSDAGACSRALAYAALGVPASDPMDPAGHFITRQGTYIHEEFQRVIAAHADAIGDNADNEVKVGGGDMGGHIDTVYEDCGQLKVTAIEIKSVDGYPYKLAIGERGEPGPKWEHVVQCALNAKARNADEAVLVYYARGAISVQAQKRRPKLISDMGRVTCEWTMPRDVYEWIAERETTRVTAILGLVDDGILPARKIPGPPSGMPGMEDPLPANHLITSPATGTWASFNDDGYVEMSGTTWQCAYCRWQTTCSSLPADRCPVELLDGQGQPLA